MAHEAAPRPRRDWRAARRALRALIRDPDRTDAVFDLIEALSRRQDEKALAKYTADPRGRRLLAERPDLLAALVDHASLARLPEGSLGRRYLDFVRANGITAEGLVEADEGRAERLARDDDSAPAYLDRRGRDCHDLWHVLTGYGTDQAGEVSVLAFTCGHYPNAGLLLLVAAGAVLGPRTWDFYWQRYLWRAYLRGRKARLDYARYEEWLALPLDEVRRLASIEPAERTHPNGIIVGGRGQDAEVVVVG